MNLSENFVASSPDEFVAGVIARHLFSYRNEADVQDALAKCFKLNSFVFAREVVLSRRDRIDFVLGSGVVGVGVEVKVGGRADDVRRQLARYASHDRIGCLVLVTTRAEHRLRLPERLNGKELQIVTLMGQGL